MWLIAAAAITGAVAAVGLQVHRTGHREPRFPQKPLTAVVLGARVNADGTPSRALIDRVRVGVWLLTEGLAQRLLLSGGSPDARPTEAATMAQLAIGLGAKEEQLVQEPQSRSTFENAARCADWLATQGESEMLLVTCDFHLARASAHFRGRGLTVWPVPSRRALTATSRLAVTGKELVALLRRPWLLVRL